jgi:hypothetical protein
MPVFDVAAMQGVRLADHTTKRDAACVGDNHELAEDNHSKTAYINMGKWMFVSFRATELRNISVFIKAPNNEDILLAWFSSRHR